VYYLIVSKSVTFTELLMMQPLTTYMNKPLSV